MTVGDATLIGERLPNEQIEDQVLKAHFENLDTVDIKKLEMKVKNLGSQQFQQIAFRKKTTTATSVVL